MLLFVIGVTKVELFLVPVPFVIAVSKELGIKSLAVSPPLFAPLVFVAPPSLVLFAVYAVVSIMGGSPNDPLP